MNYAEVTQISNYTNMQIIQNQKVEPRNYN